MEDSAQKPDILPWVGAVALWLPAMVAASHVWAHGEYYSYGWIVPPLAVWLMWRRWHGAGTAVVRPRRRLIWVAVAVLLPWLLVLRVLGYVDPGWRLPILLLGATAAVGSHVLIGVSRGWRVSASFGAISLLWMSALPWPSVVESGVIRRLTHAVMVAVTDVFHFLGKPVEMVGDRLQLHGTVVAVTDGCSGVRSFQAFVMGACLFAAFYRLSPARWLLLLACGCACAFLVNLGRTWTLAEIRFTRGEAAFDSAHDWLGVLAFVVSAAVFHLVAGKLSEPSAAPH